MDHAALNDISDVQTLRAMVLAQQAQIAVHEQAIAQRDHAIAFKDAVFVNKVVRFFMLL